MTTEQKNIEIALFLEFILSDEENDWSSNPFYCPPKWFMDAVNCDYEVESIYLAFDNSYDHQLTAIDWIEENIFSDKFRICFQIRESVVSLIFRDIRFIFEQDFSTHMFQGLTKKESIFESLYWLSQNYKNYL